VVERAVAVRLAELAGVQALGLVLLVLVEAPLVLVVPAALGAAGLLVLAALIGWQGSPTSPPDNG
jgi:hypothetical protein